MIGELNGQMGDGDLVLILKILASLILGLTCFLVCYTVHEGLAAMKVERENRRKTRRELRRQHNISSAQAVAPFGSPAMAARALAHEQTVYWQQLLAAFAASIEAEGYTFGTDAQAKVALPHAVRARAGGDIVKARSRHITPLRSETALEDLQLQAAEDGHAGSWADWCQRGAEAAGWYVTRRGVDQLPDDAVTK